MHWRVKVLTFSCRRLRSGNTPSGFTLLEALISIAILGIAAVAIGAGLLNIRLNRATRLQTAAAFLADSSLDAVRSLPYASLANQASGAVRNALFQQGQWTVESVSTPPSGSHVLSLPVGAGSGITALAVVPAGSGVDDATIAVSLNVQPGSPNGWQAGYLFRAQDREHGYVVWFSATQLKVQKVVAGAVTDVYTKVQAFSTGTWYKLEVALAGSAMSVEVNDVVLTGMPVTDTSFTTGAVAVVAYQGAGLQLDSVSVAQGTTQTWNFDSGETVGEVAVGWERFGIYDLPSGSALLTIADAQTGEDELKRVNVRIRYEDNGVTREQQRETLVGQGGVGQ